jgi:glycosyltransferase involved in cell wall biosynthesis
MMISVIIPTFNRSNYLVEALQSVLGQKHVDLELIVVDDGSSDDTVNRLQPFLSKVRVHHQPHSGVSAARNAGVGMARGGWIAFLDSDDLWRPEKLSRQLDYLKRNPGLLLCQTEEIWLRHGKRLNPKKYHKKPSGYCFPLLLERCLVSPSAVLMHRTLLDIVGLFDVNLPACEDYDLWLRVGYRFPIGLVEEPLVIKRGGHPDQLSAAGEVLDCYRIQALMKLLRQEPLDKGQRRLVLDCLRRKCRIYANGCKKRGRLEEACAILSLPDQLGAGEEP